METTEQVTKSATKIDELINQPLVFRRKVFKLAGNKISVFDQQENLVLFIKQKAFKLKEDIRVYSDESLGQEMLSINARQIVDFNAAYDVVDPTTQEKVGALRRKGFSSMFRDAWELLDKDDNLIGKIEEDSMALALIRRLLQNLIPQSYNFTAGDNVIASLKQRFNPFVFKADFTVHNSELVDPRLALAGAVLLMTIEGRQE